MNSFPRLQAGNSSRLIGRAVTSVLVLASCFGLPLASESGLICRFSVSDIDLDPDCRGKISWHVASNLIVLGAEDLLPRCEISLAKGRRGESLFVIADVTLRAEISVKPETRETASPDDEPTSPDQIPDDFFDGIFPSGPTYLIDGSWVYSAEECDFEHVRIISRVGEPFCPDIARASPELGAAAQDALRDIPIDRSVIVVDIVVSDAGSLTWVGKPALPSLDEGRSRARASLAQVAELVASVEFEPFEHLRVPGGLRALEWPTTLSISVTKREPDEITVTSSCRLYYEDVRLEWTWREGAGWTTRALGE